MKQEIPTGAIIAAVVGVLALILVGIFFAIKKGDPAMQAPNQPPPFNPAQKMETRQAIPGSERGPQSSTADPKQGIPVVQ